ncbi:organophosphate acid anhydrase [Amycolatopsis mediterranei S699]|uniref:Organophosphate acid anhydrase n=2 Tax=Amycolatopsis mediterranei TaxID=33910 RepID=A0A0H3D9Y9_AMYMU|nr:amidohydrolase family protein [Amycolatopsis mediterranei]ADJ47107.1 organophosphate acid anhydrase [Amycolatopsis mediterranei U32]AEK43925.1 organophosphate acid anhydrase [Amycolatopsis mediterranei S699]AFO78818.1 organophosphate acid anhydrase [Amycolatopsis mediterranei S699]AGT85946.1 organophosphate acid anhydrase [Amycolatopsis mediterranei RB]KDO04549.1 imidazolonepropionase [Amycolatopsis mediterranei]
MATTAITGARVFDGEKTLGVQTVVLDGRTIRQVGGEVPDGAEVVDGRGATLLPGLIDAHVHSSPGSLALALRFGVTTELEMQGLNTRENRAHITEDDTVADVRSAGFGITPPGGHPSELMPEGFRPGGDLPPVMPLMPFSTTPEQAAAYIPQLLARGSDYIKFMVDDGSVEGHPGLPMLDQATLTAGVAEAKKYGALTVAHTLTLDATRMAAEAGIDGVVHVFMDRPHTREIVDLIVESGMFVVPCISLDASMMGITGSALADDPRVARRLDDKWEETLRSSYNRYPQGKLEDVLETVGALAAAGVDLLAGTDASMAETFFGGLAHGASLHHELQYLVAAGLTPAQALRAATATTARRFGLGDRGRIAEGLRADLLLVDGDPTKDIGDTLDTRAIWRRGSRLENA